MFVVRMRDGAASPVCGTTGTTLVVAVTGLSATRDGVAPGALYSALGVRQPDGRDSACTFACALATEESPGSTG